MASYAFVFLFKTIKFNVKFTFHAKKIKKVLPTPIFKIEKWFCIFSKNLCDAKPNYARGVHKNEATIVSCFFIIIKKYMNRVVLGLQGSPPPSKQGLLWFSDSIVNFRFRNSFLLTAWMIKHIFLLNKFWRYWWLFLAKITLSDICVFPLKCPINSLNFDSFSDFLERI